MALVDVTMNSGRIEGSALIYPNFTNFLHAVPQNDGNEDQYLLFNPSIHYWIALNTMGMRIIHAMGSKTCIDELREDLMQNERVGRSDFEVSIRPFVDRLIELRFFRLHSTPASRTWVPQGFSLDDISEYPFNEIILSLTDQCNLKCNYCFNHDTRTSRLKLGTALSRLSREEIRRVLEEFREMGGQAVLLTGGEPTLNPQFLDICEDAKRLGYEVKVITNGTRLSSINASRLVDSVVTLAVSLDSLDDVINAQLWGVSEYQARRDILEPLCEIGKVRNSGGEQIQIVIKPTVTRHNLTGIEALMSQVTEILEDCQISFDISGYEEIGHLLTDADLLLEENDLENELTKIARSIPQQKSRSTNEQSTEIEAEVFGLSCGSKLNGMEQPAIMSCAPSFFVTNTGDVYPCQGLEFPEFWLGNVFTQSLKSTFSGEGFAQLRHVMTRDDAEVCHDCEFRYVCIEHCHGDSFKKGCRTTAFLKSDNIVCRNKMIRRLWLETQRRPTKES